MLCKPYFSGIKTNISYFQRIRAGINHWLDAVDHHSIHSPFFFDFYNKVIKGEQEYADAVMIEAIRARLLVNEFIIRGEDLGGGPASGQREDRKLNNITALSAAPPMWATLYRKICDYTEATRIVELGTSVGLTTLYLSGIPGSSVWTFEGSHALANVAITNFEFAERKNIRLIEGDIANTLPEFLQDNTPKIGFALVDANHRYMPTIQYFNWLMKRFNEKSVMVIDDIHHSAEMEKAWNELRKNDLVYGSVDLFRCGILFFDPALNKQHFVWKL